MVHQITFETEIYVLQGEVTVDVAGKPTTLKAGDAAFLPSGIMRKDAADEVVLATGPETEQRIARGDIAGIQPGTTSPMPPGMAAVLSKQELADLVAFLKSRQ